MTTYSPPLTKLLTLGAPQKGWPNYGARFGLTPEHIPDLLRMMQDEELLWAPSDRPEVYAPSHAMQALGQLRATAAIEPLLGLLHLIDDEQSDWASEEIPEVLGQIGPAAQTPAIAYFQNVAHGLWARVAAITALLQIAKHYPETRAASVTALTQQLERYPTQDNILNEFLIDALAELHAVEAAPLMQHVFETGHAVETVGGDWEDVQIELGLLDKRTTTRRSRQMEDLRALIPEIDQLLKVRPVGPPPGRNAPCWCGSGKKYKLCHLADDETTAPPVAKKKRRR